MRRAVFTGLALAVLTVGCGQPAVTVGAPGTQTPSVESTAPTSLASLDVAAVGEAYPQIWTFLGEDAATHEDVLTRDPMPTGFVRGWFADAAGGVLVARNGEYIGDSRGGLVRLTSDGAIAEVLPADPDLFGELVGVGVIDGRAAAIMAELVIGEEPDAWTITAYDIESGAPLTKSTGDVGLSREVSVVSAAVWTDAIAYATNPGPSNGGEREAQVVVELAGQVTELWSSDDRFVTGTVYGPGTDGPRLYVVTAPRFRSDGGSEEPGAPPLPENNDFTLLIFEATEQVAEIALPGWGDVDEDWFHLPTRISADDRYVMIAGDPMFNQTGLVDPAEAPPSPVWLFEPATDRLTPLDVTGAWSLRGPRDAS